MALFTLVNQDSKGRAKYRCEGHPNSTLRVGHKFFLSATAPDLIEVTAEGMRDFVKPVKTPRVRMTKEERAALRAARPKPTLAEKVAAAQARAARLAAKLAAEAVTM